MLSHNTMNSKLVYIISLLFCSSFLPMALAYALNSTPSGELETGNEYCTQDDIFFLKNEVLSLHTGQAEIRDAQLDIKGDMLDVRKDMLTLRQSVMNSEQATCNTSSLSKDAMSSLRDAIKADVASVVVSMLSQEQGDANYTELANITIEPTCGCTQTLKSISELGESITDTSRNNSDIMTKIEERMINNNRTNSDIMARLNLMSQILSDIESNSVKQKEESDTVETKGKCNVTTPIAADCTGQPDGIIQVRTKHGRKFLAKCENSWMVLAHRFDGSIRFYDYRWDHYKHGIGNLLGEFFIGFEHLVSVLKHRRYKLRIELTTWNNVTKYAEYYTFDVNDEADKYRLNIDGYSGTAEDGMSINNHMRFSTVERDNDLWSGNCASYYTGAGWHNSCFTANLFGRYSTSSTCSSPYKCLTWIKWPQTLDTRGNKYYSFKEMKMKMHAITDRK